MSFLKKKENIFLVLILLVALFLRLYRLDQNTPPLYADEVRGHFTERALIYDNSLGVLKSFYYKALYLPGTLTWIMGFNPLAARIPSVIYSLVIAFCTYCVSKAVFKDARLSKEVSGVTFALTTFLPWNFMLARISIPYNSLSLIFTLIHLNLFLRANSINKYLFSIIPLLISVYLYPSMVVIAPIVSLFVLFFVSKGVKNKKILTRVLLFLSIISVISGIYIFRYKGFDLRSRGLDLAIWRDPNTTAQTNQYRGIARLSEPTIFSFNRTTESVSNKILFNKPIAIVDTFSKNYLSFFSPDFLFLKGDSILRHSTGMVGSFYLFLLPFMVYGAFIFFQKADKKTKQIFLLWILISPIPGAITKDGAGYLLRVITIMPFLTILCSLGITESFKIFKRKRNKVVYGSILLLVSIFSIYRFLFGYFHIYPALSVDSFEYGFKEISDFQKETNGKILILWEDKYPAGYFCFWQNLSPDICLSDKISDKELIQEEIVFHPLEQVYFSLLKDQSLTSEMVDKYAIEYLVVNHRFATEYIDITDNLQEVTRIQDPKSDPAFIIYQTKQINK